MPLAKYDPRKFTWGFELEVGDVSRSLVIPEKLGSWEHAETDVVNVLPPYQYICCDPQGTDPPVGGEVNTMPSTSIDGELCIIDDLLRWFVSKRQNPTSNCISHTHIHVHVPGLTEDLAALKRLTKYIKDNQHAALKHCHQYDEKVLQGSKTARTYLKWDCGRPMPDYMADNILTHATSFKDFIRLQCCGKDAKSMGRPFRYAINTYCLKHIQTVEFRLFRHTLSMALLEDCFLFVKRFMEAALNNVASVDSLVLDLEFPPFRYHLEEAKGWEKTKWNKERGKKERKYVPL